MRRCHAHSGRLIVRVCLHDLNGAVVCMTGMHRVHTIHMQTREVRRPIVRVQERAQGQQDRERDSQPDAEPPSDEGDLHKRNDSAAIGLAYFNSATQLLNCAKGVSALAWASPNCDRSITTLGCLTASGNNKCTLRCGVPSRACSSRLLLSL